MIGFVGTSLQVKLIITADTLNSFWTTSVLRISHCCLNRELVSTSEWLQFRNQLPFYDWHAALIGITASKGSITGLHECVASETMSRFPSNGLFSECLQFSVSVSMETVFRNRLVSRNPSLRFNVFAHSFPRNSPHVTVYWFRCEWLVFRKGNGFCPGTKLTLYEPSVK
jgi:hypothetical protein